MASIQRVPLASRDLEPQPSPRRSPGPDAEVMGYAEWHHSPRSSRRPDGAWQAQVRQGVLGDACVNRGRELLGSGAGALEGSEGRVHAASCCLMLPQMLGCSAAQGAPSDLVLSAAPGALTGSTFYSELRSLPPAQPIETLPSAD